MSPSSDRDWWRQASVYQIYPRSFADHNGDGIGDLAGIIDRVPYFAKLGIDAVWLCPIYPSPLNDGGYDVADFRDIDPRIGTLKDFEIMTKKLGEVGIKVLIDIVPNHCSSDHVWFQQAIKAPAGSKERKRFHFIRGKGEKGELPPSDWESTFGGRAWSPSGSDDGEWYLHLFDKTQPDLNWSNPEVVADFEETIRFWCDKGVAGFRVDVASGCAKDLSPKMLDLPWKEVKHQRTEMQRYGGKRYDCPIFDRDEVLDIYRGWRRIMNQYDPPKIAVAESFVQPERKSLYASPETLGQSFSFDLLFCNFDAKEFRDVIGRQIEIAEKYKAGSTWVLSSHDVIRHADRYGLPSHNAETMSPFLRYYQEWLKTKGASMPLDWESGLRRAKAATLMMMALPGSSYLYQGEELGLPQVLDIPDDKIQDPRYFSSNGEDRGRDGCRVPLPWTTAPDQNFGYSSGSGDSIKEPHLPQPGWWGQHSVEKQDSNEQSVLKLYQRALKLRSQLQTDETLEWKDLGADVVAFERLGGWLQVLNAGKEPMELPKGELLVASAEVVDNMLPGESSAWLRVM